MPFLYTNQRCTIPFINSIFLSLQIKFFDVKCPFFSKQKHFFKPFHSIKNNVCLNYSRFTCFDPTTLQSDACLRLNDRRQTTSSLLKMSRPNMKTTEKQKVHARTERRGGEAQKPTCFLARSGFLLLC